MRSVVTEISMIKDKGTFFHLNLDISAENRRREKTSYVVHTLGQLNIFFFQIHGAKKNCHTISNDCLKPVASKNVHQKISKLEN